MSYDYVIVGGGLSGSVLASRLLQQDSLLKITIIEAGVDGNDDPSIRYSDSTNTFGGSYDWKLASVPQPNADNRVLPLAQGKGLGGGTLINLGLWTRGDKRDYDLWGETVGDPRWSYQGQLPYMKKTETFWDRNINPEQHGFDGKVLLQTTTSTDRDFPLRERILESWLSLGVKSLPGLDGNAGNPVGVALYSENKDKGQREIAASIYTLAGISVRTGAMVEKILFEERKAGATDVAAKGVQLADGDQIFGKQVILCAGAIRSPQILMLSGIGPKEEIQKHGIPLVIDQPEVGNNLSDHILTFSAWSLQHPEQGLVVGSANPSLQQPQYGWGTPADFVVTTTVADKQGLARAVEEDEGKTPDPGSHPVLRPDRAFFEHVPVYMGADGAAMGFFSILLFTTSHGTVRLSSSSIADAPAHDPNYLGTAVDRFLFREGLRQLIAFAGSNATVMGREVLGAELPPPGFEPGFRVDSSDEYLDARARAGIQSVNHPMGTCAMGKVVDGDLRVKGVRNLRVVDASVFPVAFATHIQAATYALAEQAAEIIGLSTLGQGLGKTAPCMLLGGAADLSESGLAEDIDMIGLNSGVQLILWVLAITLHAPPRLYPPDLDSWLAPFVDLACSIENIRTRIAMAQGDANSRRPRATKITRAGCIRCKAGHCTCDEQKPACGRCQRLGFQCVYRNTSKTRPRRDTRPLAPIATTKVAVTIALSSSPATLTLTGDEVHYFECFRDVVAHRLARQTDAPTEFWLRTVVRESVRDRCVLEAVIAIGALYRAKTQNFDLYGDGDKPDRPADARLVARHHGYALRHYSRALTTLQTRIAQTAAREAPRTVLVVTMLVTVFEFLQGNSNAADRVTASCIQFVRDRWIFAGDDQNHGHQGSKLAAELDDSGIEEAEYFLARKMTMSALSSPLYPRTKQSILALSRPSLRGAQPPETARDAGQYAKCWWQFFTYVILWFLHVQNMRLEASPGGNLTHILAEQQEILSHAQGWMDSTESALGSTTDRKELFDSQIVLLSARIVYLCTSCCFDLTGALWRANHHRWQQIKEASNSIMLRADLRDLDRDYLFDWLACAIVQIARECRDSLIRHEALDICKRLSAYHISFGAKCFVMGAGAIIAAEDEYRDEDGFTPFLARYTWTSAAWDQGYTELRATLAARVPSQGVETHKTLSLSPRGMGLSSHHVQQYVNSGAVA